MLLSEYSREAPGFSRGECHSKLFGCGMEDMQMPGMSYTILRAAGKEVGGIMAIPADTAGMPPTWGTYVAVDDVDATARQAEALGAKC
jgi:predicted enzyme related to lactoylglutathione lyase